MPDISKSYSWAIETCNAPDVGYSLDYRNQRTINGITYYDCSSFIWYSLIAGGFDCVAAYNGQTWPFTTYYMSSVLLKLGFTEISPTVELLPGDIGLNADHTEMCYKTGDKAGYGIFMGAHSGKVALANQVSIGSSSGDATYQRTFARIFRYGDGASSYGVSAYVASAMAGNFWQESNCNPGVWESLEVVDWTTLKRGYGLGQWTNTEGDTHGRLYQLHQWLQSNGYSDDDGNGQCAYIVAENYWIPKTGYTDYNTLSDFLQSDSTDLEFLTHTWNMNWEGIHDSSWDTRVENAKKCYNYIIAHANDTSITAWIAKNNYLSEAEILNNAVMLYRYFSAGGGGGGTAGKVKRKVPLWMMLKYHL